MRKYALIGEFQEEQHHLLLISPYNSMSNLLCMGVICMNTSNISVPLHNDSVNPKSLPLSSNGLHVLIKTHKFGKQSVV